MFLPALITMAATVRPAALAADRPPECVTVKIVNTNGTRTWVTACGSGPGAEPPIPERYDGKRLIADGAFVTGKGCGWRAAPCVLFPLDFTTPPS